MFDLLTKYKARFSVRILTSSSVTLDSITLHLIPGMATAEVCGGQSMVERIEIVLVMEFQTLGMNDKIVVSCSKSILHTPYYAQSAGNYTKIIVQACFCR